MGKHIDLVLKVYKKKFFEGEVKHLKKLQSDVIRFTCFSSMIPCMLITKQSLIK